MRLRRVLLLVCLVACVVTPLSSEPKKKGKGHGDGDQGQPGTLSALVTGTFRTANAANTVGPAQPQVPSGIFTGLLHITSFVTQNGTIMAVGNLSGGFTDAAGNVIQTIQNQPVALRVTGMDPTCSILSLTLAPLDLNVLGLIVHLDIVNLTIIGETGAGDLLGNLLCSVGGLLDGGFFTGLLATIVALLNQILAAL